jgi:hypothetical protein
MQLPLDISNVHNEERPSIRRRTRHRGWYSRDVFCCNWPSSAWQDTLAVFIFLRVIRKTGPGFAVTCRIRHSANSSAPRPGGQHVGAMSSVTRALESWVRIPLQAFMYRNPIKNKTETQYQVPGVEDKIVNRCREYKTTVI